MKTETLPATISYHDDDKKDLEKLLEAFNSTVSLKEIASAYCQAGGDVYVAGEILCNMRGSTSGTSSYASKDELGRLNGSSEQSENIVGKPNYAERHSIVPKAKKCSASIGTVSGVIGREYSRPKPKTSESCKEMKQPKLSSKKLPISELWNEEVHPSMAAGHETMHKDTEEFLFTMLGDGFQLDMNVIREVLGLCGYDLEKSMEKLLDLSSPLDMNDDLHLVAQKSSDLGSTLCQEKLQHIDSARSKAKKDIDRYDLQKEVLEALFSVPERVEDIPRRTYTAKQMRRSRAFGHVVVEPLKDTNTITITANAKPPATEDENEDTEDSYQVLRKAVQEYSITMKEYYKSAVDAFAKGDHVLAYKLLEEGHFFKKKAREADDSSAQKLLETRDDEEEVLLDLHDHEPKEAVHLLKIHLTSFSGISSIRRLKIIVGTNDEDTKGRARKRLILKVLERESIQWTEEGNGQIIVILVDEINPKRLSFAKKLGQS